MKNNGTEIYVHIPFCVRKCGYCDFVSFSCSESVQKAYFEALWRQIDIKSETMGEVPIVSVFFGGGTPSSVDAKLITSTMKLISEKFSLLPDAEISIEMNPNSADFNKLSEYKRAGFNRVSIGLQSADNVELKLLSRLHTFEEFLETFNVARKAGFDNINVDIMSALPGQTRESYRRTLEKVTELNPEHISAYSLIIEENTPFYENYSDGRGLPDEDTEREMYHETETYLKEKGYHRYEISNYAKKGYECRHNIGYWRRTPYIGFGIAAASLINNTRYLVHSDLNAFIGGDFSETEEILSINDQMAEFMFLGLRMTDGVSVGEFSEAFSVSLKEVYSDALKELKREGLLVVSDRIYLTKRGLDLANYAMAKFILD